MTPRTSVALVAHQAARSIAPVCLNLRQARLPVRHYAKNATSTPPIQMPKQRSAAVLLNEQLLTNMPHDIGLLPDTFVMPTGVKRPSWLRTPRLRWTLEKHRLKARFTDFRGQFLRRLLTYKYAVKGKPYPRIGRRRVIPTATALHRQMYTALAEADTVALSSICAEGLLRSLRLQIGSRPPSELQRWTIHKYTHRCRIVSNRGVMIRKDVAIRQVIVRIRSIQSLTKIVPRFDGEEDSVVGDTGREIPTDEYLVIQRRIWRGTESPWIVWGTTQESDLNTILGQNMKVAAG